MPPVEEGPVSTTAHAFAESYDILKKLDAEKEICVLLESLLMLILQKYAGSQHLIVFCIYCGVFEKFTFLSSNMKVGLGSIKDLNIKLNFKIRRMQCIAQN